MATVPAHFGFIAEQLKLLRDWEPRISDEQLTEGAEAMVDAALSVYGTLERIEGAWAIKVSSGERRWDDGVSQDLAELYGDWHRIAGRILTRLDTLRSWNIPVKNVEALHDRYGKIGALIDIGLGRVFEQPAPPQPGKPLQEVRDGLQR